MVTLYKNDALFRATLNEKILKRLAIEAIDPYDSAIDEPWTTQFEQLLNLP